MTNFIQKMHLDIGFSDFNCLLDSQCSLLTSQILGRCIKLKWSNGAYAVYWLYGTLLCPWENGEKIFTPVCKEGGEIPSFWSFLQRMAKEGSCDIRT